MVLSIAGPDLATALAATRQWETILETHPEVESLRRGPGPDVAHAVHELYFPRRFLLLSDHPEDELRERFSAAGLRAVAETLRDALALPEGQLAKELAPADPMLAFPSLLRRFEAALQGGLQVVDGCFADVATSSAVLFLTTRHSAFDLEHQAPFASFLEAGFAELDERFGGSLRLERSSVHRFAVASEKRARRDMQRISGISLAGIALLFIVVFRSPRLLAIASVPLAAGVLSATSAGLLLFGKLHVMTVAFGSTLIGVCIDYPIHMIVHYRLVPTSGGPQESLRRVGGAITMGALTTVAGFAGFAWSGFPGVREIGVFAAVGILGALAATCLLLPPLLPRTPRTSSVEHATARALGRLLHAMQARRASSALISLGAVLLCLAGLPRVTWQDDVYALAEPPEAEWVREDARVRARISKMDAGRFVVVVAGDEETALQRNDVVYRRLVAARAAGLIESFHSLHTFLFSRALQERNASVLAKLPDLAGRTIAALEAEGFRGQAFAPFVHDLAQSPADPLQLEDLRRSPLADAIAPLHFELDGRVAVLSLLRGVADPATLEAALADLEGVHYFDQQRFIANVYGRYRSRTMLLILVGLVAVVGLLTLRYRRLRTALVVALPALAAAACTLALIALIGVPINLLHLLGLLLVLSIGVDYAIFLVESRSQSQGVPAAMLSLCVACGSTCLAFGLLSASSFPALQAVGVTTGIGVVLSLVLAPIALVLSGLDQGSP
jgi:predicted exporter